MGEKTGIEWTDATWNPVSGCSKVSQGCKNCYAERVFPRVYGREEVLLSGSSPPAPATRPRRFTDIALHPDRLDQPLRWRKPRRVFVNSMSDLFHEDVPDEFIAEVFARMAYTRQHTFQVLTKRAERMRALLTSSGFEQLFYDACGPVGIEAEDILGRRGEFDPNARRKDDIRAFDPTLPLKNVWLGVSAEDHETFQERWRYLKSTPAAVRFISAEPLLGHIDLCEALGMWWNQTMRCFEGSGPRFNPDGLGWVIVGGESGPGARRFRPAWARAIVRQCRAAGVPVFVKQMGSFVVDRNDAGFDGCDPESWPLRPDGCDPEVENDINGYSEAFQGADCRIRLMDRKGGDPAEWPEDLRVREFPR